MFAATRGMWLRAAAALLLVVMSFDPSPAQKERAEAADVPAKRAIVRDLQRALRENDRSWIADRIRYPLRYHGQMVAVIRNRDDFLRNYARFVSDRLRTAILIQDPEQVFENWQGLMIGDGTHNMWLRESGEGEAARYEIVTINDSR
jgi:hypothetical protein